MGVVVPHLQFPIQIAGGGHLGVVEQDSDDDILSCVYVALKTRLGTRPYVPDFGVEDFAFSAPEAVVRLQDQIQASEPRAYPDLAVEVDKLVESVQVGVGNVG